jgi:DNA-directed RNA polymerase specialized sigma24 family protein
LLAEAEAEILSTGGELSSQQRDAARRAAESLARREKDLEKLNSLALEDFAGPAYEIFAGELAAYGDPVLLAWIRRGLIFKYCADAGRPVQPCDADLETLAESFDDRLGLATMTVAEALTFFRSYVLIGRRWSFDGGAALTTYFIGACRFAFPNVFRRWQGEQRRWRRALSAEMLHCPEGRPLADQPGTDPADQVAGQDAVIRELHTMPPGTGAAAALVIDGATFAETANQLGITERGVEGRLYRYRTTHGQQRRKEDR